MHAYLQLNRNLSFHSCVHVVHSHKEIVCAHAPSQGQSPAPNAVLTATANATVALMVVLGTDFAANLRNHTRGRRGLVLAQVSEPCVYSNAEHHRECETFSLKLTV